MLIFQNVLGNVSFVCGLTRRAQSIVSFLRAFITVSGRFLIKLFSSSVRRDDSDCMHITVRFGKTVLALEVPPLQQVGALKMTVAKHLLRTSELDDIIAVMSIRVKGKKLLGCDEMTLTEAGISSNCEVLCTFNIRGGSGSAFKSIPIQNLRHLLTAIRSDFDAWVQDEAPHYKRRYNGDSSEGKEVVWDGFSGSIQYFLKEKDINPCERYKELYSSQRHSIAVSYVWSATSLHRMAGKWPLARACSSSGISISVCFIFPDHVRFPDEFDKPEYQDEHTFIDVLCVPQRDVQSAAVVQATKSTFSGCWLVIFVGGNCLRRAWCALEIAVGTSTKCRLTVSGSCEIITGKRFYKELEATFQSDIDLIKVEILKIFQTEQAFNEVVARAMQVLFVVAQKSKEYNIFATPREQRVDWISRMSSTNPKMLPRDREQDWAVLTGKVSAVDLDATPRALRVFLSSTFSDTILEWRFFLQDVVPYLKVCARNRGLDFDVSDMRFGNKHEESLPLDTRSAELERCRTESAEVFCLVLLGNMCGPRPVPARVPRLELESLLPLMTADESALVRSRYVLDENQLDPQGLPTPEYILIQPKESVSVDPGNSPFAPEDSGAQPRLDISGPFCEQHQNIASIEEVLRTAALKRWQESASALRDPRR
jgi:hypothetical protein